MTSCSPERYVYVAGPLSRGNVGENIRNACEAANTLIDHGWVPFLPHTNHYWQAWTPRDEHYWLTWDLAWLRRCAAVVRLPGESPGSDLEERYAGERGIPVYHGVAEFLDAKGGWPG